MKLSPSLKKGVINMAQMNIGNFIGTVIPNTNMVDVFRKAELSNNPNSYLAFRPMSLKKFTISCDPGTVLKINGKDMELPTGIFELGAGQYEIKSLEFVSAVNANIFYGF